MTCSPLCLMRLSTAKISLQLPALAFLLASFLVGAAQAHSDAGENSRETRGDGRRTAAEKAELEVVAARSLGLSGGRLAELVAPRERGLPQLRLPVGPDELELELRPYSVYSPDFELVVVDGHGRESAAEPAGLQVVRGTTDGGGEFAGLLSEAGVEGLLLMPDRSRLWIEPLRGRAPGVRAGDHMVYSDADRPDGAAACGISAAMEASAASAVEAGMLEAVVAGDFDEGPNDIRFAQLAIDTDVEFYNALGSVQNVQAEVTNLINIVNLQYERDVRISHVIVRIVVRTSEPDPYASSSPSNLLDEFRNHWFASQGSVLRDVAHFFTGRVLQNNVAGLAYITGICSDVEGYAVVSRPACGLLACKTDLSAHELGHNWGAPHCNCPGYTMNTVVQGANIFHPTLSIPPILTYRDGRTCLEIGDDVEGLTLSADFSTVSEGNRLPLTALAQYRLHADRDVTTQVTWTVDPPQAGFVDDEGGFNAATVEAPTGATLTAEYEFDGVVESDSLDVTVVNATAAPLRDQATPDKNRYLSIAVPAGAGMVSIAVKLLKIYEPDPPHAVGVFVPDLSSYRGQIRWVGPAATCQESGGFTPPFRCARLQCEPHYASDWDTQVVHVTGGDILPSSEFEITTYPASCAGDEANCPLISAALLMRTQRWGDVAPNFQALGGGPGSAIQPDVIDIGMMVSKLKGLPSISLQEAQLTSGSPDPNGSISVIEVGEVVDAIKGFAPIFLSPCPCPSVATCPFTDYCGRCAP